MNRNYKQKNRLDVYKSSSVQAEKYFCKSLLCMKDKKTHSSLLLNKNATDREEIAGFRKKT